MPVAFFTRTQTGALVSRLNNDVIGAQRAFTSTLSGVVSNVIGLVLTAGVMLALSWQITLLSLVMVPLFVLPARRIGRRLQEITRESYELNASMNATMTERFNVAGALLVKLFGRLSAEAESFRGRAARVRDIGVLSAMYGRTFFTALTLVAALATALVYGLGGWLAFNGSLSPGDVVALALLLSRLYGPLTALANVRVDVMSAMVSFDRVFEVLDLQPMIREAPDAALLPGDRSIEFDEVSFSYPSGSDVSLPSLEEVSLPEHGGPVDVLHDVSFRIEPGQLVALVGHSGAGKSTIAGLVSRLYDATGGSVRVGGVDVRRVTLSALQDAIGVVSQDAHLFHDTIRANLLYARPEATEPELWTALEGRGSGSWSGRCPRAWTPSSVTAATGCRAARSSGWRSPACCSRAGHRDPRRGDGAPGQRVRGRGAARARHRAVGTHVAGHRPPAVHDPQRRPDPGGRRRPDHRDRHARRAAGARGRYADLYRTQFADSGRTPVDAA